MWTRPSTLLPGAHSTLVSRPALHRIYLRLLCALCFRHQRHDGVPLKREILLEGVVDVLLRKRVGSLESQRDAARVSPQQVDRLQRVQPVAVLKEGVLQAIPLL